MNPQWLDQFNQQLKNDGLQVEESVNRNLNLSIIPVAPTKIPFKGWKQYQQIPSPIENWHSHFLNGGYVGVICGDISKNLECLDFDLKNDPEKSIFDQFKPLIPQPLLDSLIIQTTPNGGFHLIYRCPEEVIPSSHKLAINQSGETIIETRGTGGYFCTSLNDYKVIQGTFNLTDLHADIPVISRKDREFLLDTARSLTRFTPPIKGQTFAYSEPAINQFNASFDISELLTKHGWTAVKEDEEKVYWKREGSLAMHSAYYFKNSRVFYVFSTSTQFKAEKPYNPFQVLQELEGKGDYRSTLRLLPKYGYEIEQHQSSKITPDDIANHLHDAGVRYDEFIQDLTIDGRIIEERDYNTLYIDMKKHFDKEVPKSRYDEVINSTYIMSFNPITEYIESKKDICSDGIFDRWFDCITLKNKSIDRAIAKKFVIKWYVGIIAQALNGKYPNEYFLTLISTKQGIGKTSLLRHFTIPKELQNYIVEHALTFDDDFKVIMGQALLVIDDEMDGKTWDTMKTFKTILSNRKITLRRKYDRRISTIHRRCSFAGSGNHLSVIKEFQNRRIIPLEFECIDFEALEKIDLDALFMEAYRLFLNGFQYQYDASEIGELEHLYRDYVQHSDIDLILDEYLVFPSEGKDVFYVTNLDLIQTLSDAFPFLARRINAPLLGKMMSERGYETYKWGKQKITCYIISMDSKILEKLNSNATSFEINSSKSSHLHAMAKFNEEVRMHQSENGRGDLNGY